MALIPYNSVTTQWNLAQTELIDPYHPAAEHQDGWQEWPEYGTIYASNPQLGIFCHSPQSHALLAVPGFDILYI
ncbi:hypothetical protein I7I50_01615 [Histoplasma capsulatum G186AR]|uniref:Uncharacterized protein n=1 Tax=Ajellomyces capsulatus TaxID=5037 RepID=A0A8H7Y9J1_AJECA|nr:hypothetical protein I7I52_11831 [Histoplasma capsulatum]QSS70945.1 hypothetical protein I7I50_01615 [Histoplasma capsulatum G186AR]